MEEKSILDLLNTLYLASELKIGEYTTAHDTTNYKAGYLLDRESDLKHVQVSTYEIKKNLFYKNTNQGAIDRLINVYEIPKEMVPYIVNEFRTKTLWLRIS